VVQLEELLEVRHSVFVVGNAGTGKTQVWKTLFRTYQNIKRKPIYNDLNPKAVTNDELFGVINPSTREWKDGTRIIYSTAFYYYRRRCCFRRFIFGFNERTGEYSEQLSEVDFIGRRYRPHVDRIVEYRDGRQ